MIPVTVLVFYFDIRYYRIPDWLTIGAWITGAVLSLILERPVFSSYAIGSVISFSSYVLVYFASRKKLGWGDIKLSLFLGGMTGIKGWYLTNILAALCALLFLLILHILKFRSIRTPIPFGPFLCSGAIISLLIFNDLFFWKGLNNLINGILV